jgi:hypothetical protein
MEFSRFLGKVAQMKRVISRKGERAVRVPCSALANDGDSALSTINAFSLQIKLKIPLVE